MTDRFHTLRAEGVSLTLDCAGGHIRALEIEADGRPLTPLHTAPWVDDPAIQNDSEIPEVLKHLSGDFFCAPFAASDVEDGPPHGWPANSRWTLDTEDTGPGWRRARFLLEHPVMGARLAKEITLRDGHPFAYQRHIFEGGNGAVSAASHAMTRFAGKGRLAFSQKAYGELPAMQQESDPAMGRSRFATSARFEDLAKVPLADGTTADLHRYPVAERHEDFVMLVEAKGSPLGWVAALRPAAGDIMLSLKNPVDYPVTFLWFSNGGRDYAPWNGRHFGVLGIEEGRAFSAYGHAASIAPNPMSEAGIPTSVTLRPDCAVALSHVLGGVPLPAGWTRGASVESDEKALRLTGDDGSAVNHPFDGVFLEGR